MRLSPAGAALTAELSDKGVPMVDTFDGEWVEPVILPARFPVLLVSGAVRIAEGGPPKCRPTTPAT